MDKLCKVSFRQNQLKETELVQIDLKVIGMMEEGLKTMSKKYLQVLVKENINVAVLQDMKEKQKLHSKTRKIEYKKLMMQHYMKDSKMTNSLVKTLVSMRSSMARGVRGNFVSSSERTQCPSSAPPLSAAQVGEGGKKLTKDGAKSTTNVF